MANKYRHRYSHWSSIHSSYPDLSHPIKSAEGACFGVSGAESRRARQPLASATTRQEAQKNAKEKMNPLSHPLVIYIYLVKGV